MQLSVAQLRRIVGGRPDAANMRSVVMALDKYGTRAGLDQPHRLAHFVAQLAHESGGFRFDREIWGPTPAQRGYEGRKDLGNTRAGDGKRFAGRGPIQVTGRNNVTAFEEWCLDQDLNPPDFSANPDAINTDPWEGLSAIWYWAVGNPDRKSLNRYADSNDIEMITQKINGRLNGFDDRLRLYTRTALVLLGLGPEDVREFQETAQREGLLPPDPGQLDGIPGPKTRAALHQTLATMSEGAVTRPAPVTEETEVPVAPAGAEKRWPTWTLGIPALLSSAVTAVADMPLGAKLAIGAIALVGIAGLLWRGELIARRVRAVIKELS